MAAEGILQGLKGVLNSALGLYDDKKETKEDTVPKTWMPGNAILTRTFNKHQIIEYDSDPEDKTNDGKSHKHIAKLINVDYNKSSITTKDTDNGAYCSYDVHTIKIKLPPETKQNTIAHNTKQSKQTATTSKTSSYTRNNYRKKHKKAPDLPKLTGFKRIDYALNLYYVQMGRNDYKNAAGKGKFMQYAEDNGLEEDEIEEEFNNPPEDCQYTDFNENFPLKQERDNVEIFNIIKYCYKYGFPQNSPDYAVGTGQYGSGYQKNYTYNNGNMYGNGGGYKSYTGYTGGVCSCGRIHGHYNYKPVWDETLEYIMPPIKENIIKDEHIIDTIGDDEEQSEADEEEWEKPADPRPDRPVIEVEDVAEDDMSSESELYQWADEAANCKDLGGLQRIDNGLRIYYEKLGRRNYVNDDGVGKFMEYAEDNGLDSDAILEEFEVGAEECTFVEFVGAADADKLKFPLSRKTADIAVINEKIYRLIKYCHQYAQPPISHVNDADIALINGYIRMLEREFGAFTIPVVILEVIRDFYPSAMFFFSFDDDWDFKISTEDIAETKRIVKKQANTLQLKGGALELADLVPVITIGRLNNHFPLMQYLFDAYVRAKVKIFLKFGYSTRLFNTQPESWLLKYPFCNKLKIKDPDSFKYILRGLKQYNYAKLFPCIVPMSLSIKDRKQIKDDLYDIFYYNSGVIQFVNEITNGRSTPFQIDFTIIVYKIFQMDGVVYKDGTTPILTVKKSVYETVGDIEEKLKVNQCFYNTKKIKSDGIIGSEFILKTLRGFYAEFRKNISRTLPVKEGADYPQNRRICFTVDRRKTNSDKTDVWFLYETPICCKLPSGVDKDFDHLIPEMYHMNSMECLIPCGDEKADIRTRLSYGITISFHCERNNQIKTYLWWDNSFMRFSTKDLNTILPIWFYDENDYEKNNKFKKDKEIQKEIDTLSLIDLHFEDFLKSWTLGK